MSSVRPATTDWSVVIGRCPIEGLSARSRCADLMWVLYVVRLSRGAGEVRPCGRSVGCELDLARPAPYRRLPDGAGPAAAADRCPAGRRTRPFVGHPALPDAYAGRRARRGPRPSPRIGHAGAAVPRRRRRGGPERVSARLTGPAAEGRSLWLSPAVKGLAARWLDDRSHVERLTNGNQSRRGIGICESQPLDVAEGAGQDEDPAQL